MGNDQNPVSSGQVIGTALVERRRRVLQDHVTSISARLISRERDRAARLAHIHELQREIVSMREERHGQIEQIRALSKSLQQVSDTHSTLLSTHLMGDIERTCDNIVVLDNGHVVETGAVTSFIEETETLAIEVDDNREAVITGLAEAGLTAKLDGSVIVIEGVVGDDYDKIRDAIVAADAPLRRLAPRRHELTEIFEKDRS